MFLPKFGALPPADSLYLLAEKNNIGIKNRLLGNKVLENAAARRRADALPSLSLRSSYSYNSTMQDLSNATFWTAAAGTTGSASTKTLLAGFTFSVPVFDGGKIKRAVQSAGIQVEKGRLEEQKLKLILQKDMAAAYDLYNVRVDLLDIARQNKTAAETNLELARERFKTGDDQLF